MSVQNALPVIGTPVQKITTITNPATTINGVGGALTLAAGSGISLSNNPSGTFTLANTETQTTVNGLSGAVTLGQGPGITITPSGNNLTFNNTLLASVVNNTAGNVTLAAGTGIGLTQSGSTFTISSTGSATSTSINNQSGALTLVADAPLYLDNSDEPTTFELDLYLTNAILTISSNLVTGPNTQGGFLQFTSSGSPLGSVTNITTQGTPDSLSVPMFVVSTINCVGLITVQLIATCTSPARTECYLEVGYGSNLTSHMVASGISLPTLANPNQLSWSLTFGQHINGQMQLPFNVRFSPALTSPTFSGTISIIGLPCYAS